MHEVSFMPKIRSLNVLLVYLEIIYYVIVVCANANNIDVTEGKHKLSTSSPSQTSRELVVEQSNVNVIRATAETDINNVVGKSDHDATSADPALLENDEEEEREESFYLIFILLVLSAATLIIYTLMRFKCHVLPESAAIIVLGVVVGLIMQVTGNHWRHEESFSPKAFFLYLLPPIIFESGYSLHKGNFFLNFGSILVFAVVGTIISTAVIGLGLYAMGAVGVSYPLCLLHSFLFGAIISAVDPVATLAIFQALNVDPTLHMLVFGESVLNDAVAIVLYRTILGFSNSHSMFTFSIMISATASFFALFVGSAVIGVLFAISFALLLKHLNLRRNPSLEFALLNIFGKSAIAYAPYVLAEALKLSGIMSILFCGIFMSHFAHDNLSPTTQISTQQAFRMLSFLAESCVFAYLGLAVTTYEHHIHYGFVIISIILCLVARAVNIVPLSILLNQFRHVKISPKFQFVMWFSGLRGAIAFALVMNLSHDVMSDDVRRVIFSSTLIVVLFTILVLGGSTLPLLRYLGADVSAASLSKSEMEGKPLDKISRQSDRSTTTKAATSFFDRLDKNYLTPLLRRHLTRHEFLDARQELDLLSSKVKLRLIEEHDGDDETYIG